MLTETNKKYTRFWFFVNHADPFLREYMSWSEDKWLTNWRAVVRKGGGKFRKTSIAAIIADFMPPVKLCSRLLKHKCYWININYGVGVKVEARVGISQDILIPIAVVLLIVTNIYWLHAQIWTLLICDIPIYNVILQIWAD